MPFTFSSTSGKQQVLEVIAFKNYEIGTMHEVMNVMFLG
jgi:hypothetical protein